MTLELLERMIKDCGKKLKPLDEEDVDFHNWDEVSIIQFYKDRYATTIDLPGAGDIYLNKYSDIYINPEFAGDNKPVSSELSILCGRMSKKEGYYGRPYLEVIKKGDKIVSAWYTIEE